MNPYRPCTPPSPISPLDEEHCRLPDSPLSPISPLSETSDVHDHKDASSSIRTTYFDYDSKKSEEWTPTTVTSSQLPTDPDEWLAECVGTSASYPVSAVSISDEQPDRALLASVYDIPLYDAEGVAVPFGSLFDPVYALHQRQLFLFIRHFYCGACQAYLQAISRSITHNDYFSMPTPTSIFVIGCGHPELIPHYRKFTSCPFPIYAEPTRRLFKKLGMVANLNLGHERPDYMKDISVPSWLAGQVKTISRSLKDPDGIRKRDVLRGGNPMQIGGEFLFEDGEVLWCHRMRNYRDHTEIPELRKVLELDT